MPPSLTRAEIEHHLAAIKIMLAGPLCGDGMSIILCMERAALRNALAALAD